MTDNFREAGQHPGGVEVRPTEREDFDDSLSERAPSGCAEPGVRYVVIEMADGGRVDRTQVPEGMELLIVDHDEYLEPTGRTRRDLEPYEGCGSCGDVRMLHRGEGKRNVMRGSGCEGFEPTGRTTGGDLLGGGD